MKVPKPQPKSGKKNKGIGGRRRVGRSGYAFEKETAEFFGGKRMPGSGAVGTQHGLIYLVGDDRWKYPFLKGEIIVDTKHGYGGKNYLKINREWWKKIRREASLTDGYGGIGLKFKGVTSKNPEERTCAKIICFTYEDFKAMMDEIGEWWDVLMMLLDKHNGEINK